MANMASSKYMLTCVSFDKADGKKQQVVSLIYFWEIEAVEEKE